jgi:hypothetical protein
MGDKDSLQDASRRSGRVGMRNPAADVRGSEDENSERICQSGSCPQAGAPPMEYESGQDCAGLERSIFEYVARLIFASEKAIQGKISLGGSVEGVIGDQT